MTGEAEERLSLGEGAYRRLHTDICSCLLAPGQRLTERALAAETGWAVGPIREALKRLEAEGLVRTMPRKGYLVTPLTVKSVDDLYTVWRLVGPELARLGIQRATPAQMAQLRAYIDATNEPACAVASLADEALRRINISLLMFDMLAGIVGNEYLTTLYRRIAGHLTRVGILLLQSDLADPADFAEHLPRTDRYLAGDAEGAAEDTRAFIDEAHTRVLHILSQWPSVVASEVVPLPVGARS